MFFIAKSAAWLAVGFLIVKPAMFHETFSDHGEQIAQGINSAEQFARGSLLANNSDPLFAQKIGNFCLDRKDVCAQTTGVIGELIVGSITSKQLKERTNKLEFVVMNSHNNKEPFAQMPIPSPRMRPDFL